MILTAATGASRHSRRPHGRWSAGVLLLALLAGAAGPALGLAQATWEVDPQNASLSFISIKAGNIAETHHFHELGGGMDAQGRACLEVTLASVDTRVATRDSRMRQFLFRTVQFPRARFCMQVPLERLSQLQAGKQLRETLRGELELHGHRQPLEPVLVATRLDPDRLAVATAEPVVLDATRFGLGPGLDKLRKLAGLPSISPAVPVSLVLVLKRL